MQLGTSTLKVTKPTADSITSAQTWNGAVYLIKTLKISSGGSLTVSPGTNVRVAYTDSATVGLNVYGALTALGRQGCPVTFSSPSYTGTHASWASVQFYPGSTGDLEYCTVQYAQIGISSRSSGTTFRNDTLRSNWHGMYLDTYTPVAVYHNSCTNNGSSGIYLYNTSANLRRNVVKNNVYGVTCWAGGSPSLDSNTISANSSYALNVNNTSPRLECYKDGAYRGGYNLLEGTGNYPIHAVNYSTVSLGEATGTGDSNTVTVPNSFAYTIQAASYSTVTAEHNYWGSWAPKVAKDNTCTVDCTLPLSSNPGIPAGGFGKVNGSFASPLDSAAYLADQGRIQDALSAYQAIVLNSQLDLLMRAYALRDASALAQRAAVAGFRTTFLGAPGMPAAMASAPVLRILGKELTSFWLRQEGDPVAALAVLDSLKASYPDSTLLAVRLLTKKAEILAHDLGRKKDALAALAQAKSLSPVADPLLERELPVMIDLWTRLYAGGVPTAAAKIAAQGAELPKAYALSNAYPNPFNPETSFRLALPAPSRLSLIIYDLLGREVARVAEGDYAAGTHTLRWNARSAASARPVASGVYFARLEVKGPLGALLYTKVAKLLLLK